jgi:hypothetical protein
MNSSFEESICSYKIGDMVQWTHRRDRGRTIQYFAMEGKILEINGNLAVIKRTGSGRKYTVALTRLRSIDEVNELTEWVLGKKSRTDK